MTRLHDGLTQLTGLVELRLSCTNHSQFGPTWFGNYRIGWTGLQSLQLLELKGPALFDSRILQIAELTTYVSVP